MTTFPARMRAGLPRAGLILIGSLLALFSASSILAQSQPFPAPGERYTDADPAGALYPDLDLDLDEPGLMSSLNLAVRRDRSSPVPLAQRGLVNYQLGGRSRGERDFARALSIAEQGTPERGYVHWSYGWALYHAGDYADALEQWQLAEQQHGGAPHWVPSTYALALWSMGARELAMDFFAVAARDHPHLWASPEAVESTTRDWRPNDRLAAQALHHHHSSAR